MHMLSAMQKIVRSELMVHCLGTQALAYNLICGFVAYRIVYIGYKMIVESIWAAWFQWMPLVYWLFDGYV